MLSQKYFKKSSSISSVDSGMGCSVKNKLTESSEAKYSQHFLQAASSTVKSRLLKRGFMSSNEKATFMHNENPVKIESLSDSENMISLQFSPLASSTQQLKESESTLVSSNKHKFNIKRNSSSEFDEDSLNPNEIKTDFKQRSKGNTKSRKKSKINILENHLIHSDLREELDSDSYLSVVEVHKPVSSYSLSSNIDSEEEILNLKSKNIIHAVKAVKVNKTHQSSNRQMLKKHPNRYSISMNPENEIDINEITSDSISLDLGCGESKATNFLNKLSVSENDNAKSPQQGCSISSSDTESSESISVNEKRSCALEATVKHKSPSNFFNEMKDFEKLTVPKNADFDLGSDDEVYLLQIPKTINPKIMEGLSFSLSKKSKLKLGSEKYYMRPQSHNSNLFLTFTNNMKTIRPLATLKMEKHQKIKKPDEIIYEESKKQPLPDSIKIRHPLFGAEYESKVELEKQIKEKLFQARQRFNLKQKKSRSREKAETGNGLTLKKKEKYYEFEIKKEVSNREQVEPKEMSLKKKKKHNEECTIKEEVFSSEEIEFDKIPLKKKEKKRVLERTIEQFPIKTEPLEEHFPNSLKKRRNSIFSSTGFLENLDISVFKDDVSKIESEEPAIKKRKNCHGNEDRNGNADLINNLLLSAKIKLEYPNNRKKSKRKSS